MVVVVVVVEFSKNCYEKEEEKIKRTHSSRVSLLWKLVGCGVGGGGGMGWGGVGWG